MTLFEVMLIVCILFFGLLSGYSIILLYKEKPALKYKVVSIAGSFVVVCVLAVLFISLHDQQGESVSATGIQKNTKQQQLNSKGSSNQAAPILATNAGMPGLTDASTNALNKKEIKKQTNMAEDLMKEKALQSTSLSDGTKQFTLTAAPIIWNLYQQKNVNAWGFNGQTSGPLLRVKVGDKVSIVLKNRLDEPTSLRFQGISIPASMGGIPDHAVLPGKTFTYKFTVTKDMVGTHNYFSGTNLDKQIDHGLHGVLIVDPAKGKEYPDANVDVMFDIGSFKVDQKPQENVFTLNGKPYPNSPELMIKKGQTVIVRIVNSSAETYHAMHLHGYTFKLVSEDGHHLAKPVSMNVVTLAPEETADIEFVANTPGMWMFHCHILDHTINPDDDMDEMGGLMTNFMVM